MKMYSSSMRGFNDYSYLNNGVQGFFESTHLVAVFCV